MLKMEQIKLLKPKFNGGKTVMMALKNRKTVRVIGGKKLTAQQLSNLLWAACGVNRKKGPFGASGRTAASASNSQEIELYVAMADGVCLYDPNAHSLKPVVGQDLRPYAINYGQRKISADAPVRILYVVDLAKFRTAGFQEPGLWDPEIQKSYYYVDIGLIAGNVALFAAATGMAAWFHNCQKEKLTSKLKLRPDQKVLFAQTIGWPQKDC